MVEMELEAGTAPTVLLGSPLLKPVQGPVLCTEHLFSLCQATTQTTKYNLNNKHQQLKCRLICSEPKTNNILQSQIKDVSFFKVSLQNLKVIKREIMSEKGAISSIIYKRAERGLLAAKPPQAAAQLWACHP